jgi:putative tricarboxylic transport membrane protein
MRRRDIFSSLFLFVSSAIYTIGSFNYQSWDRYGPGPGFFPLVLGTILCVLSAIFFLMKVVKRGGQDEEATESESLSLRNIGKSLIYLGAIICFCFFFTVLGSLPTIFLFMMAVMILMNRRSVKLSLSVSILSGVLAYVLFVRLLGVPLPGGILQNVIRFY